MNQYRYIAAVFAAFLAIAGSGFSHQAAAADETTGEYIDDTVITAKVKAALIEDDLVKARNIGVETNKGIVTLSGDIQSVAERERALSIAHGVKGVKAVADNLVLK